MQKKIFAIPVIAAVALFTDYNIYQGQNVKVILSDLALANVETLAKGGDEPDTYDHGPTGNPFLEKNIVKMRVRQIVLIKCMVYHKY